MRALPASLDAAVVAEIDRRLASVSRDHGVRIPWAIESGSRAWGFPSPDSDYDCRFIFVRPAEVYLGLWPARDVIDTPLDALFDVNGWDLAKAVRLVSRGNTTAIEWLRSPIVYSGDGGFRDAMLEFATDVVERATIARHYLHVARRQAVGTQTLKRFFYVLRPAMALRWLATHPSSAVPPMHLPTLLAESDVPHDVHELCDELIAMKAVTRELGTGTVPELLSRFAADELDRADAFESAPLVRDPAYVRARADEFFQGQLRAIQL